MYTITVAGLRPVPELHRSDSDPSLLVNVSQETSTEEGDSVSVQIPAETEGEELKVGCHVTSM